MPADPNFAEVFISHSSSDEREAAAIARFICANLAVPMDEVICTSAEPFNLPTGNHFERDILKGIGKCSVFVFLISPSSMRSLFCTVELGAAWGRRKTVIPVALPGVDIADIGRPLSSMNIAQWRSAESWVHMLKVIESESGASRIAASKWKIAAQAIAQSAA